MAYPTLSVLPASYDKVPQKNDMTSGYEGGYEQKRPRFSRSLFDFHISYTALTTADKTALESHVATVKSTVIFTWTDPIDGTVRNVRFVDRPALKFEPPYYWGTSFVLREV